MVLLIAYMRVTMRVFVNGARYNGGIDGDIIDVVVDSLNVILHFMDVLEFAFDILSGLRR